MSMNELTISNKRLKVFLLSCLGAVFIVFPNLIWLPCQLSRLLDAAYIGTLLFFLFRFFFFVFLIRLLAGLNMDCEMDIRHRLTRNVWVTAVAYLIYLSVSLFTGMRKADFVGSFLVFQFLVVCVTSTLLGHVLKLYYEQKNKELEIEKLKTENLQSRCDALANQINPHFFFNSLNSLAALVRRKDEAVTLEFINKLSDVFRYILQSDKKGLVSLSEELEFVEAFSYLMEVRFANKLEFSVDVPETALEWKLPVLSLLPLIDNVVVHNRIDSDHRMHVLIGINERQELVVTNPIYPKAMRPVTNGTGLRNLRNRFDLLMRKAVRVENDEQVFRVCLPLLGNA